MQYVDIDKEILISNKVSFDKNGYQKVLGSTDNEKVIWLRLKRIAEAKNFSLLIKNDTLL